MSTAAADASAEQASTSTLTLAAAKHVKALGINKKKSLEDDHKEFKERNQDLEWQDNGDVKACHNCTKKFSLTNRRHHCRQCGHIYCGSCSQYKSVVNGALKRSCLSCYKQALNADATPHACPVGEKAVSGTFRDNALYASMPDGGLEPAIPQASSSADLPTTEALPSWAEGLVFIKRDAPAGQQSIKVIFPENALPESLVTDVAANCLPQGSSISAQAATMAGEANFFFFRVRDKAYSEANSVNSGVFYFCYACYRHTKAGQQALVLVSKWPFHKLAYRLLSKLEETISAALLPSDPTAAETTTETNGSGEDDMSSNIQNVMMVAYGNIMLWPSGKPGYGMYMPFLGELFQYPVPEDIPTIFANPHVSLSSSFWSINLISTLGPLGLIQHFYRLWEMVAAGHDIVVYGTSPAQCADVVVALASLLAPLNFVGDVRPYVTKHDSDLQLLNSLARQKQLDAQASMRKNLSSKESRSGCRIVGTDDSSVVDSLDGFSALILLAQTGSGKGGAGGKDGEGGGGERSRGDAAFLGMRTRNAAVLQVIPAYNPALTTAAAAAGGGGNLQNSLVAYLNNWVGRGAQTTTVITRYEPSDSLSEKRILQKIKQMDPTERMALGDALLRDNLRLLTLAFFNKMDEINEAEKRLSSSSSDNEGEGSSRGDSDATSGSSAGSGGDTKRRMLGRLRDALVSWTLENVPTVMMWVLYVAAFLVVLRSGLSLTLVSVAIYFVYVPERPSKEFEDMLSSVVPGYILYPNRPNEDDMELMKAMKGSSSSAAAVSGGKRSDLSGVWKRVKCINYEAFMGAQGAGLMQRKIAASISMVHTITMDPQLTALRMQEKGGPIDTDNLFVVGGPELQVKLIKKDFLDKVYYDENNVLTIKKVPLPDKDYHLIVRRYLEDGGKTIRLVGTYYDNKNPNTKPVETICFFEKQGPSPNPPPASVVGPDSSNTSGADSNNVPSNKKPNFSGVWTRTKTHNFDAFIGVQGAGYLQRKLAASIALTHTITMDSECLALRLQEKGGTLDLDNTYTIGNDFAENVILNKKFKGRIYWLDNSLILHRVSEGNAYELVMTRTLENDDTQIILKSLHRDLATNVETVATSWFTKSGPSPNKEPVPQPDQFCTQSLSVASNVPSSSPSSSSSSSPPSGALKASPPMAIDDDDDNDDDEVALQKMRTRSTAITTNQLQFMQRMGVGSIGGPVGAGGIRGAGPIAGGMANKEQLKELSGVWVRQNNMNISNVTDKIQSSMKVAQTITVNDTFTHVRLQESVGGIEADLTYRIGGASVAVEKESKRYNERVYCEGGALVMHRVHARNDFEVTITRYVETDGSMLRQVSIHRNLLTGEESESMMLFTKSGPSKSKVKT